MPRGLVDTRALVPAREYPAIVRALYEELKHRRPSGQVASYIPALAKVDPMCFGVAMRSLDGLHCACGDAECGFSIQSVSKLFTFTMAFARHGEALWTRLGKAPSGTAFNSLWQIEAERGVPRNPFINAGAIVISDILMEDFGEPLPYLLEFIHELTGDASVGLNEEVWRSELAYGARNAALAYLMKSFGNIHMDVQRVLKFYFQQCAITMSCQQLTQAAQYLANQGVNPLTGQAVLTPSQTKRTNALLLTSGLYNEAGDFAFRVGLPAKSGVGGGIVAIIPRHLTITTWSPPLNALGNSALGVDFLELFTTRTRLSVF